MRRWLRPAFVRSPRRARLAWLALLDGARIEGALERAREALGDESLDALEIEVRARATDGGRFERALDGRPAMTLEARDEHERTEVARCQRYASIEAELDDPPSLEVLRAGTVLLSALAAEGDLTLALDVATARWWPAAELAALDPARPFGLDEHVQVVVEAAERRPGVGHLVRSRGLVKLARPDVGARGPRRDAERVSELLRDVARMLADGALVEPGVRLRVPDLPPVTFVPRTDDALAAAPADEAPLYELRDLEDDGRAAEDCSRLLTALRPKAKLRVVR